VLVVDGLTSVACFFRN